MMISMVADLTRSNPNAPAPGEPEVYDGTAFQNPEPDPVVDAMIDSASDTTSSWWTGPWPVLHVRSSRSLSTGTCIFEMTIDFLGAFSLIEFDIWVPELDVLNEEGKTVATQDANTQFRDEAMPQIKIPKYIALLLLLYLEAFAMVNIPGDPVLYQVMLGLLAAWCGMMIIWLYALGEAVRMEMITPGAAYNELFEMLVFTIGASLIDSLVVMNTFYKTTWKAFRDAGSGRAVAIWGLAFNVLNIVTKVIFIGILGAMMIHYLHAHLQPYTHYPAYT